MALVIPPGFAALAVELRHEADPDSWFVTFAADWTGIGGDPVAAMNTAIAAWTTAWNGELQNTITTVAMHAKVGQDGADPINFSVNIGLVGASTAEKLPQNCALLVRKNTSRGGRPGRGRCFIPGVLTESQVSGAGIISNSELTDLANAADLWLERMNDGDPVEEYPPTPMVLLHNETAPGGTVPTPINFLQVDSRISTQRKRLR